MLAAVLALLGKLLPGLLSAFLNKTPVAVKEAEKAGASEEKAAAAEKVVAAEASVAQAEADAPKTQAEVIDRLRKGTF